MMKWVLELLEEGESGFKALSLALQVHCFVIHVFMQHLHQDGKEISSHMSVLIDLVMAWRH